MSSKKDIQVLFVWEFDWISALPLFPTRTCSFTVYAKQELGPFCGRWPACPAEERAVADQTGSCRVGRQEDNVGAMTREDGRLNLSRVTVLSLGSSASPSWTNSSERRFHQGRALRRLGVESLACKSSPRRSLKRPGQSGTDLQPRSTDPCPIALPIKEMRRRNGK